MSTTVGGIYLIGKCLFGEHGWCLENGGGHSRGVFKTTVAIGLAIRFIEFGRCKMFGCYLGTCCLEVCL